MRGFREALEFLTILRLNYGEGKPQASCVVYFPLVGAFLGLVLLSLNNFLRPVFADFLLNLTLVVTLIILTGALHLDGLADACDAIFSGKNKETMLAIMRDSHKGTFGVLGIIIIILFKLGLLISLPQDIENSALFLMTTLARYSMCLLTYLFPYARPEGKAKIFFENKNPKAFWLATLLTAILSVSAHMWTGLAVLFLIIVFTIIVGSWINRKLGGITGDILGALSELNESIALLCLLLLARLR